MKQNRSTIRDYSAESTLFLHRAIVAFAVIVSLTLLLLLNLYNLQVRNFVDYRTRSNENRIKVLPIAPVRGNIYDRNGEPLAINRTLYQLEITPGRVENLNQTLTELRQIIDLSDDELANFEKERKRNRRFDALAIKQNLTQQQMARFAVNQFHFPGVEIKGYQRRVYPQGADGALTHAVGYVAKINDTDVKNLKQQGIYANYAATHDMGKLGIERYYESLLHGKTGYEEVEVNNRGRVIRQLHEQTPQAGADIYLTLDLELQKYVKTLLGNNRAAVIVSDPNTGGILALVSNPSYDPNLFVDGISVKNYQTLLNNKDRPMINRATQGLYPPASTIKPFMAIAALNEGVITPNTTLFDPGWWQLPNSDKRFRDWKHAGHGDLNVYKSIVESADTFFYQVAYDMGIDRMSNWMRRFGFGDYTGIDLVEERNGLMPTREWKRNRFKKPWYHGDTIPVGIGQGYWTATPIQMMKSLNALINNGEIKTPHLLAGSRENKQILPYQQERTKQISNPNSPYWALTKKGMYGVANTPKGTAYRSFIGSQYNPAVKSGTAQVFSYDTYNTDEIAEHLRDHKLMIAFAPYDKPQVSIALILENGGTSLPVGEVTRKILDHLFEKTLKQPAKIKIAAPTVAQLMPIQESNLEKRLTESQ